MATKKSAKVDFRAYETEAVGKRYIAPFSPSSPPWDERAASAAEQPWEYCDGCVL